MKIKSGSLKRILGLDIDEGALTLTELTLKKSKACLTKFLQASSLAELTKELSPKESSVVINLPTQVVFSKSFQLASGVITPKTKKADIVKFLLRQNMPIKLDECYWDTFVLDSNLNIVAAKKEVVDRYITQLEELGLCVLAVTSSYLALYNILIHNHKQSPPDKFVLLNIRLQSSDLLIYEQKRLFIYPLSLGRRFLKDDPQGHERFSGELQRTINAHYMQNPSSLEKSSTTLYLSGQANLEELKPALINLLSGFSIVNLAPFDNIANLTNSNITQPEAFALSLGLGLTYFKLSGQINTNLIQNKIKQDTLKSGLNILKLALLAIITTVTIYLAVYCLNLSQALTKQQLIYRATQQEVQTTLPKLKALKEEKVTLEKLKAFLTSESLKDPQYIKALAILAEGKPANIFIKELELKAQGEALQVALTATAPTYDQVNSFLATLKAKTSVSNVKVLASSFPAEAGSGEIEFKLRFDLTQINTDEKRINTDKTQMNTDKHE